MNEQAIDTDLGKQTAAYHGNCELLTKHHVVTKLPEQKQLQQIIITTSIY